MVQLRNDKQNKPNLHRLMDESIYSSTMKATLSIPGVICLSDTFAGNLTKMISVKDIETGIKVYQQENVLFLDIFVVIYYGEKIPQLAWDIQKAVKDAVESCTDYQVKEVNIHIQGVLPKEG